MTRLLIHILALFAQHSEVVVKKEVWHSSKEVISAKHVISSKDSKAVILPLPNPLDRLELLPFPPLPPFPPPIYPKPITEVDPKHN